MGRPPAVVHQDLQERRGLFPQQYAEITQKLQESEASRREFIDKFNAPIIAAALLHDVVEDTEYTVEDMERIFGPKIASMVDGLTKMSGVFNADTSEQAEYFRKVLLTLSDDVRVILIKIADRLHNMRTLGAMPLNKQIKITGETIYLFAPLAYRLGLYSIKSELEDLCMKYRFSRSSTPKSRRSSRRARPHAGSSSTSSTPRSSPRSTATTSTTRSPGV